MNKLTPEELTRYSRHLVLKDFGKENQEKLKQSSVLVIGAGGLGCPALLYLAAAGVGKIGIVDFDNVQESNLQRQVLFTVENIGYNKARSAKYHLEKLNPFAEVVAYTEKLTSKNALEIITHYDIVLDGSDNFPTRYLVNDACVLTNKPLVYGSILQYEGQLSVFNVQVSHGMFSANYRDLFPEPPQPYEVPNCEQAGVLGVLPGTIGSLMANETIKLITNIGETLINKLFLFDSLTLDRQFINIPNRNTRTKIKTLVDYDDFCGLNQQKNKSLGMKEVTVQELKALLDSQADFQLIDVRELYEFEQANIGGEHIPMADVPHNIDRIQTSKQVVIHCRSGGRSGNIIQWLEKNHGFKNLYNLKGGILAWAKEIDPLLDVS
ncbi:MAG: molybdopterin-synthase adenylyltransferase MoeB [Cyclobacteriaceae bacterium]|nr:molybdopterin-synthase adenylyltransferase MoeB [Cyclobacteriaceae bacterium]UYN88418.1 MAG: molybdopterin-synthase adenylyltransferase MoeB [Cyclobacteriaceae bacterium]